MVQRAVKFESWRVQQRSTRDAVRLSQSQDRGRVAQILRGALASGHAMTELRRMCLDNRQLIHMTDREVVNHVAFLIADGHLDLVPDRPVEITKEQLKVVFPKAEIGYLAQVANDLNVDLMKYGLATTLQRAHFFAQVRAESGPDMAATIESLNYSPDRLQQVFSYYRTHKTEAAQDGYQKDAKSGKITRSANQETVANKAYANRNGNGGVITGDGWKFRGRGLKQVTGRANYARTMTQYNKLYRDAVDFLANPDLMAKFPYSVRSAVCFWTMNGLNALAEIGDSDNNVDSITIVMNKYTDSYAARRAYFRVALDAFK